MSVTIEISNTVNLRLARKILGAISDSQAAEIAIDRFVKENEAALHPPIPAELPDSFWDDLFSQPQLSDQLSGSRAIIDERNEDRF
ncbi:MAG: hypothetical protein ABL999_05105 [Pyrinomonadaceae bacterium]